MKEIDNYQVNQGEICLMSSIRDILGYYNCPLTESSLLGMCEGKLFYYGGLNVSKEELKNTQAIKILKMGGMKYDINQVLEILTKNFAITVKSYEQMSSHEMREMIKKYINQGKPLMALVLGYYLEYSPSYHKEKLSHSINIIGYDFEKDILKVTDSYVNTVPVSKYCGTLSWENFYKSLDLSEAMFEMQTRDRIFIVSLDSAQSLENVPKQVFKNTLIQMADNNLRTDSYLGENIYCGIEGMKHLFNDFSYWDKEMSDIEMKQIMQCLHNLITNFGGPKTINMLMAEYVHSIFMITKEEFYQQLEEQFIALEKKWSIFANVCYKFVILNKYDVNNLQEKLLNIIECEQRLYLDIKEKLEQEMS